MGKSETENVLDDADAVEDSIKEVEDDEAEAEAEVDDDEEEEDEEEEVEEPDVVEQTESQDAERVKEKQVQAKKPLQMIGVQLLKDSNLTTTSSKKSRRRASRFVDVRQLVEFQFIIIQRPSKLVLVAHRVGYTQLY